MGNTRVSWVAIHVKSEKVSPLTTSLSRDWNKSGEEAWGKPVRRAPEVREWHICWRNSQARERERAGEEVPELAGPDSYMPVT